MKRATRIFAALAVAAGSLTFSRPGVASVPPTTAPTYQGDVVGPGLADMYPVDVASAGERVYVLDTGRYRVVEIDPAAGTVRREVGGHGRGPGRFGAARGIAADSAGNVYVADTPNNRVQKFSPDLGFLAQWGGGGTAPGQFDHVYGVTIGSGRGAGDAVTEVVYTTDGGRVQKFTAAGVHLATFGQGLLNQPRDLAVHPVTRDLYVLSARAQEIVVFDDRGRERFRFGSTGTADGQFQRDMRGIEVTAGGEVFVVDEGNSRIQVFTSDGTFLRKFGSGGDGPGQFDEARGLAVTAAGDVYAADMFDHAIERFTASGTFVARLFGGAAPLDGVNAPRGVAVDVTGRLYTMDWFNQRVLRTDANGEDPLVFGYRGGPEESGSINYAWDLAVQPGTGRVFIANRENHEVAVFEADGQFVNRFSRRGSEPGQVLFPQSLAFAPDGTLVVADTQNHRISKFAVHPDGSGTFLESYGSAGSSADGPGRLNIPTGVGVAADGTIWVADTRNHSVQKRTPDGQWTRYRDLGGRTGAFRGPWGVTVAPDGSIWVADTGNDRIVAMSSDGAPHFTFQGTGAAAFDGPFEVAFGPDGQIYISDVWNNRVQQWAIATDDPQPDPDPEEPPAPEPDVTAPQSSVTAPERHAVFPEGPVTFRGTATDDVAVAAVRVAIQDRTTRLWSRTDGTWGSWAAHDATLIGAGTPDASWEYTWTPPAAGAYGLLVAAVDGAGNVEQDTRTWVPFEVEPGTEQPPPAGSDDVLAPQSSVSYPGTHAVVPAGPVRIEGTATDDVAVAAVRVAIQDRTTRLWWRADGTWGPWAAHEATLTGAGTPDASWEYIWLPPGPGDYGVLVTAVDHSGKKQEANTWVPFTSPG